MSAVNLARSVPDGHIRQMTADPHARLRDSVFESVFDGPAESDRLVRQAVAQGKGPSISTDLGPLVDKIHQHAYKVTDEDVAQAKSKYGDDQMFEIIVSAALGASRNRLLAVELLGETRQQAL